MEHADIRVLLIEDDFSSGSAIKEILASESDPGYEVHWVDRLSSALEELGHGRFQLILLDLTLPDSNNLDTLIRVRSKAPQLPIVVLTGLADERLGVRAVREGAQDYLVKGQFSVSLLLRSVRYAIERKRLEDEVRRQTDLYQTLLKAHSDVGEGFLIIENQKIVRANEASCRISGYNEKELLALPSVLDLVVPEQRELLVDRLRRRLRHEKVPDHYETHITDKRGTRRDIEVAVKLLEGDSAQVIIVARDTTERKREMVRAERHEAARKMLQVLMHEIYNPLTGITGNLSLLDSEEVSPQVRECLKDIEECARRIQFALNQLKQLDLAEPAPLQKQNSRDD
ncbi:MAG TPA: response regulator [Acidobacteriota bacterium]